MRKRYPVVVLLVLVAAIALGAALVTADAGATPTWTCGSCHTMSGTHPTATHHVGIPCATCHVNGTQNPPTPAACKSCHTAIPSSHPPSGGCFAAGCHAAPTPTPTPTPTLTPTPTPTPTTTSTPTPTPSPSATDDGGGGVGGVTDEDEDADDVGFPATGYPPSDGGSTPWLLITGAFAAGLVLLFAVWRIPAARRHD